MYSANNTASTRLNCQVWDLGFLLRCWRSLFCYYCYRSPLKSWLLFIIIVVITAIITIVFINITDVITTVIIIINIIIS